MHGIDGRIRTSSSSSSSGGAEGGTDTAEVALEIGGLSLQDRHAFADASYADLLGSLSVTGGGDAADSGGNVNNTSSLLSLSLKRETTQDGSWGDRWIGKEMVSHLRHTGSGHR